MRKLFDTVRRAHFEKEPPCPKKELLDKHVNDSQINGQDVYRFRKQRGINLGSWFVLERWITQTPFRYAKSPAQSDLDVAQGTTAREILLQHWDTWIMEEDWQWIAGHGFNSVRIPIGYYHLCGIDPTVIQGTDFEPYYETFRGAWERLVLGIRRAAACNIGVLIDLHAASGKQNNDAHAGTAGPAKFFDDSHHQKVTIHTLCSLVKNLQKFTNSFSPPLTNIIGIELLNEPSPSSDHDLKSWYRKAISSVRSMDPTIPIYIADCWRTEIYTDYIAQHPSNTPTVLDHHLYRCFTASDISTSADAHARALTDPNAATPRMLASAAEKTGRAGGGIVIGEWSGALNPGSLRGTPHELRNFVNAQLELFEKVCAGWFFWTYKKESLGDVGWSLRDSVDANVFPSFVGIKPNPLVVQDDDHLMHICNSMRDQALATHTQYWSRYPGRYDHARFNEGYLLGWDDTFRFIASTPPGAVAINEIGFKEAWANRRTHRHDRNYWEFEAGFLQAIAAATKYYRCQTKTVIM